MKIVDSLKQGPLLATIPTPATFFVPAKANAVCFSRCVAGLGAACESRKHPIAVTNCQRGVPSYCRWYCIEGGGNLKLYPRSPAMFLPPTFYPRGPTVTPSPGYFR